jgi:hypothetical protein
MNAGGLIMARSRGRRNDYHMEASLLALSFESFVAPVWRIPSALFSKDGITHYHEGKSLIVDMVGLGFLISMLMVTGNAHILWLGQTMKFLTYVGWVIIGIVGLGILVQIRRFIKRRTLISGMSASISLIPFEKALKIMDNTARWYNDENEANRELVTCFNAMGIDAEYQYKLPHNRTADARVRNIIVEGKLSPNSTNEIDVLMGQLSDYTGMGYMVGVVIYGKLEKPYKRRIEDEIEMRYRGKVALFHLADSRRMRSVVSDG